MIPNPPEEIEYDTLKDIYLKHMSDDDVSSPVMDIIAKKISNNTDQILANTDPKCVILIFDIIRDIVKGDEKYETLLKPFIDKATLCENKDEREILTGVFNYNHSIALRKK